MKKLVLAALAGLALLAATADAFAGYYDSNGIYHQTCSSNGYQGRQICS